MVHNVGGLKSVGLSNLGQLIDLMNHQREQDAQRLLANCQSVWSRGEMITDNELLTRLGYTSPDSFQRILDAHPAKTVHDSIGNINTAFAFLETSRLEIIRIYGQFHALVAHGDADEVHLASTMSAATKEVYTFSCASYSLVQAYRHLKSAAPQFAVQLTQLISEIFANEPVGDFVMGLRVSYNHNQMFKANPSYRITSGDTKVVESTLKFDKQLLLKNQKWTSAARAFLEGQQDLDVIDIVNAYFKLAQRLHQQFQHQIGMHEDNLFKDYVRLQKARKIIGEQVWLGIVLQSATKRSINPYAYLDRYFTSDELTNIMCLGNHSQAQVDYMIGLKDPMGLCSEDTRRTLYKLFAVPGEVGDTSLAS